MPILSKRPLTPSQRFRVQNHRPELSNERPVKKLTKSKKRSSGRNNQGRITSRRRGGGHKKLLRIVDFKRDKQDMPAMPVNSTPCSVNWNGNKISSGCCR